MRALSGDKSEKNVLTDDLTSIIKLLSRLGEKLHQFRPEYVDAVNAAVWNHWFILSLLVPPAMLLLTTLCRCHWTIHAFVFLCAVVLCWFCFGLGVRYIWDIKEIHTQTPAELADVTNDTAKLFAPVIVGVPYAIFYNLGVQLVLLLIQRVVWLFGRAKTKSEAITVSQNAR